MTHQLLSLRNRIGLMYHYLALNTLVVSLNVTGAFKVKCWLAGRVRLSIWTNISKVMDVHKKKIAGAICQTTKMGYCPGLFLFLFFILSNPFFYV